MSKTNNKAFLLTQTAPILYWIALTASIVVLLRGHNEPGGGFIGGLLAASSSILWALAYSAKEALDKMPFSSALKLSSLGVILTGLSGVPALVAGYPFLHHFWITIPLILFDYKISTVLLFDLGVYLCVWGVVSGYAIMLLDVTE